MNKSGDFVMLTQIEVGVQKWQVFHLHQVQVLFCRIAPINGHLLDCALENPGNDYPKR